MNPAAGMAAALVVTRACIGPGTTLGPLPLSIVFAAVGLLSTAAALGSAVLAAHTDPAQILNREGVKRQV